MRDRTTGTLHTPAQTRRELVSVALPDAAERWRLFAAAAVGNDLVNGQARGLYVMRLRARRASTPMGLGDRLS